MNAKRQTIWLVSMLSLMVVLSAYYLFTEDVNKLDKAASGTDIQNIKVETQEQGSVDVKTGTETKSKSDAKATDAKATDAKATDAKATDAKATDAKDPTAKATTAQVSNSKDAKTDAQVISQLNTQGKSGTDYFLAMQMQRNDELSKKFDDLMKIINESKDKDAAANATEQVQQLEDKQERLLALEETLQKDYQNVLVSEVDSKWQVLVQANKLEKSQAVSIADEVMKEMNVGPEKIVIKYMN